MTNQLNTHPEAVRDAIKLLFYWQYGSNDSFHDIIYRLFQKADSINLAKLKRGFPDEFIAWSLWNESPSQDEFFKTWGFTPTNIEGEENSGLSTDDKGIV